MNTKTFAQLARTNLMKGVENKLTFWGFDKKGNITESPENIEGGYMFRGEVYDDVNVLTLWNSLKSAITKKGIDVVKEEAAYTWFNRMMAINILAKNNYEPPQLEYAIGMMFTPIMLKRARQGYYDFLSSDEQRRLKKTLPDYSQDQASFAILLVGYCHSHTLLKSIFGGIDDYTELLLPDNILSDNGFLNLLNTTDAISDQQYQEVELIGWLYQFYISDRKDEVFASFKKNKKAEAKDIPAATQIFTPNWIVKYMVQNTVGKLWLDLHPKSTLKPDMKYLVEGENPEYGNPIIKEPTELKLLDPACGSGHILVEGFDLLFLMYKEDFYTDEEAVESILKYNLFGLDIDKRAVQLSRFAVCLKAAKRYPDVLKKGWMPHIYAMPEPIDFSRQEIFDFLGSEGIQYEDGLSNALELMKDAQNLGSIMQFELDDKAMAFFVKRLMELQQKGYKTINEEIAFIKIASFVEVISVLGQKYEVIIANPPYMGQKNMNDTLKFYVNKRYPLSKSDLFAIFMEVCISLNKSSGLMGMINMQSWMFLTSFEELRKYIIDNHGIVSMLHLGPRTFEELNGEVVQSTAFVLTKNRIVNNGIYYRLVDYKLVNLKENNFLLRNNEFQNKSQANFTKIPGSPIAYWISEKIVNIFNNVLIGNKCFSSPGVRTGKDSIFIRNWFEINRNSLNTQASNYEDIKRIDKKWYPITRGGEYRKWYGNFENVINLYNEAEEIKEKCSDHRFRDEKYYFKDGVTWTMISSYKSSFRYVPKGILYGNGGPVIFAENNLNLLAFLNSNISDLIINLINPTLNITKTDIEKLPFPTSHFNIQLLSETNIEIAKKDYDSSESSWNFDLSNLINEGKTLKISYQYFQRTVTKNFFQLHTNEEELNRIFIEIYGLQGELTPKVALKDITILQDELDSKSLEQLEPAFRRGEKIELPIKRAVVMQQLISYAMGIFMGRYRLDRPGLHIAHPNPTNEEIAPYTFNGQTVEIDDDAIVPLMGSACDFPDDAVTRFKNFLDIVWGEETRIENINFLQECLDQDLEKYIVTGFWKTQCSMYKKKPIYWLFASPKGAFQVLVYMHRMNPFTAEMIRSNYLINHLKSLRSKIALFEKNESSLGALDSKLLDKLRKDLTECEQYDMVLKTVADQQISFDLDDGVTANYKLFEGVVAEIK